MNISVRIPVSRLLPIAALLIGAQTSFAQEVDNREIYTLANGIADNVELIREVMGRPFDDSPRLPASEVSRLELFFQARTLFRKANQLAQEFGVAEAQSAPPAPAGDIEGADIFEVLQSASGQIQLVKDQLGIEGSLELLRRESGISDTGIFMTIIDISRQLNLVLDQPIQPGDVYDQVAFVNGFAAGIIRQLSSGADEAILPDPDGFKTPADVYGKLLECLALVSRISLRVEGAEVMSLSSRRNIPDDIEPGHVYDIAVILVADVATLAAALDAGGANLDLPTPDFIFPTQVYRRALLLEQQLMRIDQLL